MVKIRKRPPKLTNLWRALLFCVADELELLGGPGYELAKRNLDMMDTLMQDVQEFYDNWEKRVIDITDKHEEALRLHAQ